jgi:oligopeptide transport system permease protein
MFNKKKKEMDSSPMKAQENQTNLPTAGDFEFVQMDKSIHDVKFQTKPTTFLGDAMRRFAKNRSSVVASVILGILIGLAIFLPVFDTNNITAVQAYQKDLPPRWSMFVGTGFLDGTTKKTGVIGYDPNGPISAKTDLKNVLPNSYDKEAIVKGTLKTYWSTTNSGSIYGYGGTYSLRAGNHTDDPLIKTPYSNLDLSADVKLTITFDPELIVKEKYQPQYSVFASVAYDPANPTSYTFVTLQDYLDNYHYTKDPVVISDIKSVIVQNIPSGLAAQESYKVSFGVQIKTNKTYPSEDIGIYPAIYFDSFLVEPSGDKGNWSSISFTDANEAFIRGSSTDAAIKKNAFSIDNYGIPSIFNVNIPQCDFRFDNYLDAFGEKSNYVLPFDETEKWRNENWMKLDPDDPSSFEMLDDRCPIRAIDKINKKTVIFVDDQGNIQTTYAYELVCTLSLYRYRGYSSMPSFIFGTESHGWDYAKYLFTGLRTSLLLGVFSAVINISLGLVWGSVSGYFGGWTDIIMERFTEILGGMPWIVVMTLCILTLGQNFWTFLLALCLTGWLGVAGETREQFYRYKGREYVLASRTLGASDARLIFKHILPNGAGTIITGSVLMIPGVIFSEATIAYLGLGLKGMKSFGVALSDAQSVLSSQPYLIIAGSIIVSVLMICFNLFGNGLRDAFNPSLKGVEE